MDLGLYVHVPFCAAKCGYCDFASHVPSAGEPQTWLDALAMELQTRRSEAPGRIATVFVGGGTPTSLPDPLLARLLALVAEAAAPGPDEFTVEANPETLHAANIAILADAGVNRVSLGVQSFLPDELAVLQRRHVPEDVVRGVKALRAAGIGNLNLDLIFGIPGQTPGSWMESLRRALDLVPEHMACYGLTYEPGTPLAARRAAGQVTPVDEEDEADMYVSCVQTLAAAGLEQYEISNFARPGRACRHNLRYWENRPVIGVGPGAAGYLGGRRWKNVSDVAGYARRLNRGESCESESETLSPRARAGETAMLALRKVEGIDAADFASATGFDPLTLFAEPVRRHAAAGLLRVSDGRIALTDAGRLVADRVLADFLMPDGDTTDPPSS